MAWKIDKRGIPYVSCRSDESIRYIIYYPIRYFGDWVVTKFGIENFHHYYPIRKCRLWDKDWHDHIAGKDCWDVVNFDLALAYAKHIHIVHSPMCKESD